MSASEVRELPDEVLGAMGYAFIVARAAGEPTTDLTAAMQAAWSASPGPALVETLRKAREYVQDHQDAQPNDETRDDLARIDATLSQISTGAA